MQAAAAEPVVDWLPRVRPVATAVVEFFLATWPRLDLPSLSLKVNGDSRGLGRRRPREGRRHGAEH
jgi:hypothetical protein